MTNDESNDHAYMDDEKKKAKIGIIICTRYTKGIDQILMRETLQKHGVI